MNRGHHAAAALAVHLKGAPEREADGRSLALVSSSASTRGDSALVSLSNLDAERAHTVTLDLRGRGVTGHRARVLTSPELAAHNTAAAPETVVPREHDGVRVRGGGLEVDLPAHSYVTVELDLRP